MTNVRRWRKKGKNKHHPNLPSEPQRPCRIVKGFVVIVRGYAKSISLAKEPALCHMQTHDVGLALGRGLI